MANIETYIDTEFLEWYHQNRPITSDENEEEDEKYFIWKNFYWYIKNFESEVILKSEPDYVKQVIENPSDFNYALFRFLAEKYNVSCPDVKVVNELTIDINVKPHLKFQATEKLCADNSIAFRFCSKNFFQKWEKLRNINDTNVVSPHYENIDSISQWSDLGKSILKCNAMVIVDRYLFSYYSALDNNFSKLLDLFLPQDKNIEFQLVIVTLEVKAGLKNIYNKIYNYIKEKKKFKNFQLTVVLDDIKEEHDRRIFTNFQHIHSSNSFNFFDDKNQVAIKTTTTVEVYSLIKKNKKTRLYNDTYNNLEGKGGMLKTVKNIVKNSKSSNSIGSKICRLLD